MVMIIAFITMVIDHIGYMFFPGEDIWRIIGRIAFPFFAWGIARGSKYTHDIYKYLARILILALVSQIPVIIIFGIDLYNIYFTLSLGLLSIIVLNEKRINAPLSMVLITLISAFATYINTDYGGYGVLMIVLFHLFYDKKMAIIYFIILTIAFNNIDYNTLKFTYNTQIWAVMAPVLLYLTPIIKYDFKLNKYLKYAFYPVHLVLLYMIYLYLY